MPEWLRGGLKIHCTQVRMGSNPIADTVFSRIRWVQLPGSVVQAQQALKAQRIEKVSLVTQNIPGEVLRHFR